MNKQKALYDELTHFYSAVANDMNYSASLRAKMGNLVRKARAKIAEQSDTKQKIHQLLQLFYGDWGFHCDPNSYFRAENLYLPYVLEYRKGMPVSIGSVLLYLAERLALPIYPVNFPTQLMLRAEVDGEVAFIDPWDGRYVSQEKLNKLYQGAFGFGAKMKDADLAIAETKTLLERFRQLAKNTLIREEFNDAALIYIESLLGQENDPYDIRDRGLVLAQMGCYHSALEDLQYFIDKCPQDPTAFLLKAQLNELKNELKQNSYPLH